MNTEQTDEFNKIDNRITARLERLQRIPERSLKNATLGRAHFLFKAQEIQQTVFSSSRSRHEWWARSPFCKGMKPVRINILATIILAISLVFGGASVAIAEAQSANPDQLLYGIKLASEDVRSQVALRIQTRFELALNFANRRIAEVELLSRKEALPPMELMARYQNLIQSAFRLSARMPETEIVNSLTRLQQTLQQHEQVILHLQKQYPEFSQYQTLLVIVQTRVQFATGGIEDPQLFRYAIQNGQSGGVLMTKVPLASPENELYGSDKNGSGITPTPSTITKEPADLIATGPVQNRRAIDPTTKVNSTPTQRANQQPVTVTAQKEDGPS